MVDSVDGDDNNLGELNDGAQYLDEDKPRTDEQRRFHVQQFRRVILDHFGKMVKPGHCDIRPQGSAARSFPDAGETGARQEQQDDA